MSEAPGKVRLRLRGEPDEGPELPILADGPALVRTVAVVGAHGAVALGPLLAGLRAALPGAAEVRAILTRAGAASATEGGALVLRAGPSEMAAQLAALDPGALRIGVGAAFVALARPGLTILLTAGASRAEWEPRIRQLRPRFDLVLDQHRDRLAADLATRFLATTGVTPTPSR